jgi:hypothetical protein
MFVPPPSRPEGVPTVSPPHPAAGQFGAAEVLALLAVWFITTMPLLGLVAIADGLNDKPWGYHASPASYWRAATIGLAATVVVAVAAKRGGPSRLPARCLRLGVSAAALLIGTWCLWGVRLLLEDCTHTWYQ